MRQPAKTYRGEPCRKCGGTERYDRNGDCIACRRTLANLANEQRRRDLLVSEGDWPHYVEAFNRGWRAGEAGKGAAACPYLSPRHVARCSAVIRLEGRRGRWWRIGWRQYHAGADLVGGDFPKLEPAEQVSYALAGSGG